MAAPAIFSLRTAGSKSLGHLRGEPEGSIEENLRYDDRTRNGEDGTEFGLSVLVWHATGPSARSRGRSDAGEGDYLGF